MNWKLLLFSAMIVLLYVPLTLVGTNTFFPQYSNYDSGCYSKYPSPIVKDPLNETEQARMQALDQQRTACDQAYQDARNEYSGQKLIVIMMLNVAVLLLVLFVTFNDSIRYGLFAGVAISAFCAILSYQDTHSKLGIIFLAVLFALVIWFINREKDLFLKKRKGK